ncbi:MAG: VOC family protein [Saprospiraceae bacterium]|jgi:PhnB protein|nr:VOC family protein [Saprospiraceae bacterium]
MKNLNVYLHFNGNCQEALNFYKDALGGEIASMQTYGQSPVESPAGAQDYVMHAEFKSDGIYFMAGDTPPENPVAPGSNVTLSINLDDKAEQTRIFDKLSVGGHVTMELQDTFWGARFGMLDDKFGVSWMLNCDTQ